MGHQGGGRVNALTLTDEEVLAVCLRSSVGAPIGVNEAAIRLDAVEQAQAVAAAVRSLAARGFATPVTNGFDVNQEVADLVRVWAQPTEVVEVEAEDPNGEGVSVRWARRDEAAVRIREIYRGVHEIESLKVGKVAAELMSVAAPEFEAEKAGGDVVELDAGGLGAAIDASRRGDDQLVRDLLPVTATGLAEALGQSRFVLVSVASRVTDTTSDGAVQTGWVGAVATGLWQVTAPRDGEITLTPMSAAEVSASLERALVGRFSPSAGS